MSIGMFDTDSQALQRRIDLHAAYSRFELNDWIFEALDVQPGMSVLELGCGTGKQTRQIIATLKGEGSVTSLDISAESIAAVDALAKDAGTPCRVTTVVGSMDALPDVVTSGRYDRIVSSYALYYTEAADALFDTIRGMMTPGGVFFFCGPSGENNAELRRFHYALRGEDTFPPTAPSAFMSETGPALAGARFSKVQSSTFENPMDFADAAGLCTYWRSYNLYDPALEDAFTRAAEEHFASNPVFRTVKRAIGVRCAA